MTFFFLFKKVFKQSSRNYFWILNNQNWYCSCSIVLNPVLYNCNCQTSKSGLPLLKSYYIKLRVKLLFLVTWFILSIFIVINTNCKIHSKNRKWFYDRKNFKRKFENSKVHVNSRLLSLSDWIKKRLVTVTWPHRSCHMILST